MNRNQENSYAMGFTLRDFLNQNVKITSPLPEFGTLFKLYSDNMDLIHIIREQQEMDKTGFAENKEQLKSDLIAKALDISRKTGVYAQLTNNVVLFNEVHYSETDLKKSPGYILEDRARLIHDKANANLTALEPYGVTGEALIDLKNATDLFTGAILKPRQGIMEKKQATEQLVQLFKANDALLRKIDLLMEIVRSTQPLFYAAYWNNRKVIDSGKNYLNLLATITDAATKTGIKGVKVIFDSQNGNVKMASSKNDKPIIKVTADKGKFRIKSLPAGTYTATLNKPGYQEKVVPVTVVDNETTEMVVEMERS